ncbi:hypothetical protein [Marinirhabdus gelatinilytica]|uniref:Uncharacterized protein n=1 Tax=Marinirhabdus gelatinilytica TaxID=1703343 RepID=A0A370QC24_9FLAO|nr:hypothetical protein [Marinirhabdus gelatinilytica]RDK85550.1 hypothetical protein C8D94_103377 [Marinirhabdus gelatinilytica]
MEIYKRVIELIDTNLIFCLIPIILTLILVELIFKNRFETKKVLNLICWIIVFYTITTWTFYLIGMATTENPDEYAFVNRATGLYAWAYWVMFLSALILPFTLLIRKLRRKFWFVLLVTLVMKSGFYFERYVIIVTSFHRDYLTGNGSPEYTNSLTYGLGIIFLQGIVIAILTLGIFEIMKQKNIAPQ